MVYSSKAADCAAIHDRGGQGKMLGRSSRTVKGFSLIELLVVIAIVAILAAILYPVLVSAKQAARYTKCLSNTSQLTKAILLYAHDYDNIGLPLIGWGGDCWGSDVRQSPLWRYLRSGVLTGNITNCPNDMPDANGRRRKWSITMNGYLIGTWFWFANVGTWGTQEGMPYGSFSKPNRLPAWVCENTDERLGMTVNDTTFCNVDITSWRHGGWAAITYLDGHSGRLKGGLMWLRAKWPDGEYIFRPTNVR
jgi:prepilin-type N-terminal cleavage/methylation domain-containing protein/prepilin-type processing-associated H-X9-DG protein